MANSSFCAGAPRPRAPKVVEVQNSQQFGEGGIGKGVLAENCPKLTLTFATNMRQICDDFAHPSSDLRNEMHAIVRKFGAQSTTNLHNAPLANAPFSEFLEFGREFMNWKDT